MPEVVYVGPFDSVEVQVDDVRWMTCKQGESINVPSKSAARLLEQSDNWAKPTTTKADPADPED